MRFPHVRLAAGKVTVHDAPGGLVIDVTLGEGLIRRVEVNLYVLERKSRIERIVETIQLSPTCHRTCSFIELRSLESCRCARLESFAGNCQFLRLLTSLIGDQSWTQNFWLQRIRAPGLLRVRIARVIRILTSARMQRSRWSFRSCWNSDRRLIFFS
jgi:hypothetical protein